MEIDIDQHLATLELSRDATVEQIRSAWKRAVRASHPDISGERDGKTILRVNAAYEALKHGIPESCGAVTLDDDIYNLKHEEYRLSRDLQGELHANAARFLDTTLGIHVPLELSVRNGNFHFFMDDVAFREGDNIVLPVCHLERGVVEVDVENFVYFMVKSYTKRGWNNQEISDVGDKILEGYIDVNVYISPLKGR